jgi:hypothetical protein
MKKVWKIQPTRVLGLMVVCALAHVGHAGAATYSTSSTTILRDNATFVPKGVNCFTVFSPSGAGTKYDNFKNNWKFNTVREYMDMSSVNWSSWDTITNAAINRDMVVIIANFGWGSTNATGWRPASHPNWSQIKSRWAEVANRYKGKTNVWFNVWNEPFAWNGSDGYKRWQYNQDMRELCKVIRDTGANNPIVIDAPYQGGGWTEIMAEGDNIRDGYGSVIFNIHCYGSNWSSYSTNVDRFNQCKADEPFFIEEYCSDDSFAIVDAILDACTYTKIGALLWDDKRTNSSHEKYRQDIADRVKLFASSV